MLKIDEKNPTYENVLVSFAKQELPDHTGVRKMFPCLVFDGGEMLVLFHSTLKSNIADALRTGKLNFGDTLKINYKGKIEGKGQGDFYHAYDILINEELFIPNNVRIDNVADFLNELE